MRHHPFACLFTFILLTHALFAQQGPPPGGPPPLTERLKHVHTRLTTELALTTRQQQSVDDAYKAFFMDMDKLMGPPPARPDFAKVEALTKNRDQKIRQVLTNEQFAAYQKIEKSMRPPQSGRGTPDSMSPPPRQ